MQIHRIPVLSDNYVFLLHQSSALNQHDSHQKGIAAVVDPAIAEPVLALLTQLDAELVAIFNTHHHSDHVGGNRQLLQRFPQAIVYGGAEDRGRIPGQSVFLQGGDRVTFGSRTAEVLFVPGHTRAHIAYYFPPPLGRESADASGERFCGELFCGDTLFSAGCGRLFEGTPAQMVNSLSQIRALPDATRVWCAHEYTLSNLRFAITVDDQNERLRSRLATVQEMRQRSEPTIPVWLGEEKLTNPFLRWDVETIQAKVKSQDPVRTFGRLRGMKDLF
jgi:hydroxyacylglutathione hydrolase